MNKIEKDMLISDDSPRLRWHCWVIFLVSLLAFAVPSPVPGEGHFLLTKSRADSWNDQARIATVESLAERGTMAIDFSKWGWFTGDKVFLRDHFYSTKPPLLSAVGAINYWIFRKVVKALTGHEITYLKNEDIIYPWVTITTCGISFALLLVYFYRALLLVKISQRDRWLLFWSLALGTLYLPYSTVFNNHTVAGAGIFITFYYLLRYRLSKTMKWWEALIAGFASAFAGVNDFTGALPFLALSFIYLVVHDLSPLSGRKLLKEKGFITIGMLVSLTLVILALPKLGPKAIGLLLFGPLFIVLIFALYLAIKGKPATFFFLFGTLPPIFAHLFLNSRVTGNWLPTYIQSDVYITAPPGYFGEVISPEMAGVLFWARWKYVGTALFGIRGVFLYTPTLLLGLWAVLKATFGKKDPLKWEALVVFFTVLLGWGYVLFFGSPNFGGTSYGFRYSLPAVPLLLFFAHRVLKEGANTIPATLFKNALLWSVFVSLVALPYPWGIFGPLPSTQCSIIENLQFISANIIFRLQ